jgi:hypothetical protein
MTSAVRARIDALLAAHTAHHGDRIVVIDWVALLHGIGELIDEVAREAVTDALREHS